MKGLTESLVVYQGKRRQVLRAPWVVRHQARTAE